MKFWSEEGDLPLIDAAQVNRAHERWYAAQAMTSCKRCDKPFPNAGLKVQYCSVECELGQYIPPKQRGKYKQPKPKKLKHLPIGSFRSNWS